MSRTSGRRSRYTDEEKAEFQAAADALYAASDNALEDPETVAQVVSDAQRIASERFLNYSIRNQILVFQQAAARGITITDIDTKREWRKRGRRPIELGLRILAPRTGKKDESESAMDDRRKRLGGFIMVSVFDISMTAPIDGAEESSPVAAVEDPTGVLWDNLVRQAGQLGLTVAQSEDAGQHGVDADAGTVTVTPGQPFQQLARLIGPLVAARSRGRVAAHAERESGIPLDLGEFGRATAEERVDLENARVYYDVASDRASGTFTVSIDSAADSDQPHRLNVDYGEEDGRRRRRNNERKKLPVVNGITIVGATHGIDATTVDQIQGWRINCWRPTGYLDRSTPAPPRTTDRVAAIVRALLLHFLARPDLDQLHRASVAIQAPRERDKEAAKAADLDARIAKLMAERDQHLGSAERYDEQADSARRDLAANSAEPENVNV